MTRATHYGTCQACGRNQKLPNGELSNHGYSVQWGFFQGVCPGSRKPPFEKSCSLVERFIENAKNQKENFISQIKDLKNNNTNKTWYHHYVKGDGSRFWKEVEVIDGIIKYEVEKPYEVPAVRLSLYGDDKAIAKKLDERKIKWIEKQIKGLDQYIEWQESRIKNWKEEPLAPVK